MLSSTKPRKILLSIPTDAVGLLIGKEGKTFNEISISSNAKLNLQLHQDIARGSRERFIIIEGEIEQISTAARIIIDKLSSRNNSGSRIELIKWVISQSRCSVIIGRNGSGIKAINAASGSWVKIAHVEEACPGENQRLLYIRGTKAQNDTALAMVKQIAGGHALETSITEVDLDLSDQIDFTIPARYAEDAIRGIDDVEIQLDPEFDVFVGQDIKVKLISRNNSSVSNAQHKILSKIAAFASNPANENSFNSDQSMYIAVKTFVHTEDDLLLSNEPNSSGVNTREILKQKFKISLLYLPTSTLFSQSISMKQIIVLGPQDIFLNNLNDILFYLTSGKDQDSFTVALNNMKKAAINKPTASNSYETNMNNSHHSLTNHNQPLYHSQHNQSTLINHFGNNNSNGVNYRQFNSDDEFDQSYSPYPTTSHDYANQNNQVNVMNSKYNHSQIHQHPVHNSQQILNQQNSRGPYMQQQQLPQNIAQNQPGSNLNYAVYNNNQSPILSSNSYNSPVYKDSSNMNGNSPGNYVMNYSVHDQGSPNAQFAPNVYEQAAGSAHYSQTAGLSSPPALMYNQPSQLGLQHNIHAAYVPIASSPTEFGYTLSQSSLLQGLNQPMGNQSPNSPSLTQNNASRSFAKGNIRGSGGFEPMTSIQSKQQQMNINPQQQNSQPPSNQQMFQQHMIQQQMQHNQLMGVNGIASINPVLMNVTYMPTQSPLTGSPALSPMNSPTTGLPLIPTYTIDANGMQVLASSNIQFIQPVAGPLMGGVPTRGHGGSFHLPAGDYSFLYTPPLSPSSPNRTRKRFNSKGGRNEMNFNRSRSSSSDSMMSSIDGYSYYQNLVSMDATDKMIDKRISDNNQTVGIDDLQALAELDINNNNNNNTKSSNKGSGNSKNKPSSTLNSTPVDSSNTKGIIQSVDESSRKATNSDSSSTNAGPV